jgi:putative transposase
LVVAGISKQAHYKALKKLEELAAKTSLYINYILEIREIHPGMGLRSIYDNFAPSGIGRDAFIALGVEYGLVVDYQPQTPKTTVAHPSALYPNLLTKKKFTDVNQIWSSDITYFMVKEKWYYINFIMDVYSRRIVGYSVADNLRAVNNVRALQMAFDLRKIDDYRRELIHHSDRGSQYISQAYTDLLKEYNASISMCSSVLENAHVERVHGMIKNQYLKHWKITTFAQLRKAVDKAVYNYNYLRPHKSLGRKTPVDYEYDVKELDLKSREQLTIFTYHQNNESIDPNQLTIEF